MKKLSYLFLAIIAMYITACGVTPEIQPATEDLTLPVADGKLDIAFTDAKLNTDASVVAASGDNVNVSLVIKKTPTGEKPRIMRVFVSDKPNYRGKNDQSLFDGGIKLKNRDEQTQTIDFTVSATTGKNYLHFDVYDSNEKVTRKTLVINISADGQIASWVGIVLGGQSNLTVGSRVASATGDVYTVCDIDSNMKFIDITYAAFGSPSVKPTLLSNPERQKLGFSTTIPASNPICGGGSTAGGTPTYFTIAPSTVDFSTATDAILNGLTISETSQNIVVEVGKTYAFINSRKKKGLIKITGLDEGFAGKITFDIKVQK
jgi:hypothetical protein